MPIPQKEVDASIAAFQVDIRKWKAEVEEQLDEIRVATGGGKDAMALIQRGQAETMAELADRKSKFRNVPICGFGAAAHAWLLFGESPRSMYWLEDQPIPDIMAQIFAKRQGKKMPGYDHSADINKWYRDVMDSNHWGQLSIDAAYMRMQDGKSVLKVYERPTETTKSAKSIGLALMPREFVKRIPHKDDPSVTVGAVEIRQNGKALRYRLWTPYRWDWVDETLQKVLETGETHSFGVVPFAWLGNGESLLKDAVLDQKELIHRESIRLIITNSQGFSLLEMHGTPMTMQKTEGQAGEFSGPFGTHGQGPNRVFWFRTPDGSINFASPDAPLDEHRMSTNELMVNSMRVSLKLPGDLVSDSGGPEQPTSIQFHWLISLIQYTANVHEGVQWMDEITTILAAIASTGNYGVKRFDKDKLNWEHEFRANPLPHDKQKDREADRLDVASNLMAKEQYVYRWVHKTDDPDELLAYMELLEKQGQASFAPFGGPDQGQNSTGALSGSRSQEPDQGDLEDGADGLDAALEPLIKALFMAMQNGDIAEVNRTRNQIAEMLGIEGLRPLNVRNLR